MAVREPGEEFPVFSFMKKNARKKPEGPPRPDRSSCFHQQEPTTDDCLAAIGREFRNLFQARDSRSLCGSIFPNGLCCSISVTLTKPCFDLMSSGGRGSKQSCSISLHDKDV